MVTKRPSSIHADELNEFHNLPKIRITSSSTYPKCVFIYRTFVGARLICRILTGLFAGILPLRERERVSDIDTTLETSAGETVIQCMICDCEFPVIESTCQ